MKLTIEEIETLSAQICEETETAKEKLARLIRAFARIVEAKEPGEFSRMPRVYADEDGHFDNSYPPDQKYKQRTGPRLLEIIDNAWTYRATSEGFYHESEYYTTDRGLFVAPDGSLLGADMHGTGSYGQFAAHPGECSVECEIDYEELGLDEIPLDRLAKAERELRALAFPLATAHLEAIAAAK